MIKICVCDAVENVMRQKCDKIQSLQVPNYAGCDDATQLRVILTLTCVASAKVFPARSVLCSFPKEPKGYARIPSLYSLGGKPNRGLSSSSSDGLVRRGLPPSKSVTNVQRKEKIILTHPKAHF